jgi:branched-chain amino acid transport system substrate-binding protein
MATQDRLLMFSGGLMSKLLDPRKYPYYFTLCPTYSDMARICIKYIHDTWTINNRKPKLVLICPDNAYGKEIVETSEAYGAEIGVEVGPHQIVNWPTVDATPQLLLMQEFDPDYAFITSTAMNAAYILKDANRLGLRTQFICNIRTFNEDLDRFSMGLGEGVLGIQPITPYGANVSGMEKIVKCHRKWHLYHHPNLVYVEGWANILVPMRACKIADEAGKLTCDGLKEVLETFRDFDTGGLVPPISYFQDDHRPTTQTKIHRIEKGNLIAITDYIDIGRDKKYFEM